MTDVEYTKNYFAFDSDAVDDLYHNENDNTLVIDWNDKLYRFNGVTKAEAISVANGEYGFSGGSIGAAANRLKQDKGPGVFVGNYDDLTFAEVPVKTGAAVPKDLTYATSVNVDTTGAASPTREYSLVTPAPAPVAAPESDGATITVFFTLAGSDTLHEYTASDAETVEEAIAELNTFVSRVKATGKVRKVVVEFAD